MCELNEADLINQSLKIRLLNLEEANSACHTDKLTAPVSQQGGLFIDSHTVHI